MITEQKTDPSKASKRTPWWEAHGLQRNRKVCTVSCGHCLTAFLALGWWKLMVKSAKTF